VLGFASSIYNIEDKFFFLAEYDNFSTFDTARFNAGVKFFIVENLSVDLAVRDIAAAGRSSERVININYTGRF
jgi:hypothetical protein